MDGIINPLEFVNRESAGQQMTVTYCQQGYSPPSPWHPAPNAYSEKLYFEREKAEIKVGKERELCFRRLELERLKQEIRLQNKVRLDMLSYEIYKDAMGRIIYSRVGTDQENFCSKILLNVCGYRAVNFVSFSPQMNMVMSISWEGCRDPVHFKNTAEGIPVLKFLKKLKAKGILFRTSKRSEREVADALLAYSLNTQEEYEIPFDRGWNVMEDGRWHFAKADEMTMKEIIKDEY